VKSFSDPLCTGFGGALVLWL